MLFLRAAHLRWSLAINVYMNSATSEWSIYGDITVANSGEKGLLNPNEAAVKAKPIIRLLKLGVIQKTIKSSV